MFDEIGNLPLHPLIIHATVLATPVTLLLAVLFAVPKTRSWARWPLGLAALGALVATIAAKLSGQALAQAIDASAEGNPIAPIIAQHSALADQLLILVGVMAVLAVAASLLVGRVGGTSERRGSPVRDAVLVGLLVVVSAVASFWVYRVGDLGAEAVWNPAGTTEYSVSGG